MVAPEGGCSAEYQRECHLRKKCIVSDVSSSQDPVIAPYVARVMPTVQQMLTTIRSRIAIIPNVPQALETARSIQDIQEILSRKPAV